MSRLLAAIAVSLFALACISSDADLKRQQNCGPALSDDQILKAAQRWLSVASPGQSIQDLHPSIKASGCQYVVIIPNNTTQAVEDVTIIVDRRGRVRNLPICCDLGDCPEWCTTKSR